MIAPVYSPDHPALSKSGYVSQHRLVAEKTAGRYLTADETVHHKNGKRDDNRPSNLLVLSHSDHMALHARERHARNDPSFGFKVKK